MKPPSTEYSQYLLHNVDNYKSSIQNSSHEILAKFTEVMIEYMRLIAEKINIKNKQYYIFIFERGIETLIHIFSMIFYYTKNLELTFYHSQKAYYFYIEFIEQISDDNITFLQLSSRDALMFVYKKTIFELNNEFKKTCPPLTADERIIVSYMDAHMNIYKKLVSCILLHNDFLYGNKLNYINESCDKIQKIVNVLNESKIKKHAFYNEECIYLFISILTNVEREQTNININTFFDLLDEFIKRIMMKKKTAINEKIIINKLYNCSTSNYIKENGLHSLVNYIFSL